GCRATCRTRRGRPPAAGTTRRRCETLTTGTTGTTGTKAYAKLLRGTYAREDSDVPAQAGLKARRSNTLVQLHGNQLRDPGLLHRNAVEAVRDLHGLPAVRNDDELRLAQHASKHVHESADIGIVERRVDFVEQAKRAWLVLEHAEHQGDGGERFLAARQ